MIHCLAFVGNLEAALTHAKVHSIHIYKPWERLIFRDFRHIRLLILIYRYFYFNLFASSLANRFHETRKSWMWVYCLVQNESRFWELVNSLEVTFILLNLGNKFLIFTEVDVVFCTKHTYISGADKLQAFWSKEITQNMASLMQFILTWKEHRWIQ